jgi:uncharacterized alkaline shock family protein YloU
MLNKVIFFFAWIGIFFLSLAGIVYAIYPTYFINFNVNSIWFKPVILVISIIYFLITLLKLFSKFSKTKDYEVKTEHGIVSISSETVKSTVRGILNSDPDIRNMKIETENRGRKYDVIVILEIASEVQVNEKVLKLQEEIRDVLKDKLGLETDRIEIKIARLSSNKDERN